MAYSTQSDIQSRLSLTQLIQLANDAVGSIVDAGGITAITEAIADADEEINAYCAKHYEVPFVSVPNLINRLSVEIAIVNLNKKRSIFSDEVKARREWADKTLKNIANGIIELTIDTDTDESAPRFWFTSEEPRGW